MVTIALFTNHWFYFFGHHLLVDLLTNVSAVGIYLLAFIFGSEQSYYGLAVVYRSICNIIVRYKLILLIAFHMIFISIIGNAVFLCPPGICVFLLQLIVIFRPVRRYFTFFYLFVFFLAVALFGYLYKARVHYLSLVNDKPQLLQSAFKQIEKLLYEVQIYEPFLEMPDGFAIGHIICYG